jgi:hypothetical protein
MRPTTVVTIDPDDPAQVAEIAMYLDVPVEKVRTLLLALRDRQLVAERIETYWRANPEPKTRRTP